MAGLSEARYRGRIAPPSPLLQRIQAQGDAQAALPDAAPLQSGDFARGLASAATGMVGSTKAFAASGLDALGAKDAARGLYDSAAVDARNAGNVAPEIATTDQITDFSTGARYVAGKFGSAIPSTLPAVVGGLGGGYLLRKGLGKATGAAVGSTASYVPITAGGHVQALNEDLVTRDMDPGEKVRRGLAVGVPQAVAEGVAPAFIANRLLTRNAPATSVGGAVRNFGKDVGTGMGLEGAGAAAADVIGQYGMMDANPAIQYNPRQTFEQAVGDAVGGSAIAVPGAAVANTLDYLNAGKNLAVEGAGNIGGAVKGAAGTVGDAAARNAPGAVDAVKGAAKNFADAGAMFKNTASGYLKHPELAKLVAAQTVPPELENATQGEIEDWLASDGNDRKQAALNIAQRTLIDREASDSERAAAQQLIDNPNDVESWKPFADGLIAKHQVERLASKAGALRSKVAGWVEGKLGKTKANLERTPKDDEYLQVMRPSLLRATGVKDDAALDEAALAVRDFLLSDATRDEAGWERMPSELTEALGEFTPEVLAKAYDALRRQGLTRDIKTKQELIFYTPEVVKRVVDKQVFMLDRAVDVVAHYLTPSALQTVPSGVYRRDIVSALQHYLSSGKTDPSVETDLDQMFGPNKDEAVEQLIAIGKSPQSSLARGPVDEARGSEKLTDEDSELRAVDGETGSDAQEAPGEEYNNGITETNTSDDARYLTHKLKGKPKAFDRKNAFVDEHVRIARKSLSLTGRRLQRDRETGADQLKLDSVGVVDYADDTGDSRILDELIAEHPDLTNRDINSRFYVMRNEASEVDQGEAIDVNPDDLEISVGKKGSWQARTRIDRHPDNGGNIDVSTLANGRLYLSGGPKTPIITSSRVLIERMWDRKKLGAFDEKTADQTGAADKLAMFSAGLTSLMIAGGFTNIQVKRLDGEMVEMDSMASDPFVIWDSNDAGAKLTLGQARGLTNSSFRAKKQKERKGVEPEPKKESEQVRVYDIPNMTRTELGAAAGETAVALGTVKSKIASLKDGADNKNYAKLEATRQALESKFDAFLAGYHARVTDRAPGGGRETAAGESTRLRHEAKFKDDTSEDDSAEEAKRKEDAREEAVQAARGIESRTDRVGGEAVSETEEMAAGNAKKYDNAERKFNEDTGLEVQPKQAIGPSERAKSLEVQVKTLRAEYKALADKIKELEGAAPSEAVAAPVSVLTMPMNYKDGQVVNGKTLHMREEFRGKSTMDLILSGERTATTGSRDRFEDLKEGDVFTVFGNGKRALVRVTKAPYPVARMSPDAWSALEGWAPAMREQYARAYQMQYELASEKQPAPRNVYFGSGENASLSNLADRAFEHDGHSYRSVEHAYQALKSGAFDPDAYARGKTMRKAAGRLGTKTEGNWNLLLMKQLVLASFQQNSSAKATLLATGADRITHTQDKGVWGKEFPRILTEVRTEIGGGKQPTPRNAVREGALKKMRTDLAEMVAKGKELAAKRDADLTKLARLSKGLDDKSAAFVAKQKVLDRIEAGRAATLKKAAEAEAKAERAAVNKARGEELDAQYAKEQHVELAGTSPYLAKDQAKSDKANKFIGRGSSRSSTAAYAKSWGAMANTGEYSASDTVFLSVEGARTGRAPLDIVELGKATKAGATIITDDKANRSREYNIGEREAATFLSNKGYTETSPGAWQPAKVEPAFLRDAQGESASTPAVDDKALKDIAYLEATIAAYHGEKTAAGAYEAAVLPDHPALNQIAKAFGARVRGFKVIGDKSFFSGVYQGGNREVIYLSDAAKRPHMALLGHELVHQMKKTNPALYAKFEAAVSKHIKPEAYKAWSKMFPETGDKLREEFMAEVVSDGMMDRTFWEALAKKDMSLAKQVYASVMRLFKQIMASVGYTPKTKSVLDDYAAVMKIAGEVMAEHGATSLRTMNENSVRAPDGAKFSLEEPAGEVLSTEQAAEISAYVEKTLGPKVTLLFADQMKGSGEWSRDAKNINATIRIATTALNPLSVAHHEAMHEFFQRLLDGKYERAANVLRNAADSPLIKRQLQRHFAGQTAVLEQIENDVEERIAYMFQLWASGKLDIGTQTETVFRKIINVIRKTLGLVSQEKQLEEILQSFNDGKMSEPSAMAQVLDSQEARSKYLAKIGKKANPALKKANEWVGFAESALTGSKNPFLDAVGRTMNNKTGTKKDAQGFLSAKEQANNLYMNKFANALRGIDPTGKDTTEATKADVDLALEGLQTKVWHKDPLVLRIQKQVEAVLDEMHGYMDAAGVKVFDPETKEWNSVRKIKDYRIPRSWDPAKIIEHSGKFKEMLFEHHEKALNKIADQANAEIAAGKDAGEYTASWEKLTNGDKKVVTAEDVATAIVNRLINSNGQDKLKESATALGFSPFAKSVNEQTLWWIDEKVFAEFMEKDITKIISTYVGQITKRAEYSRRFGADGEVLQKAMDEALNWELDQIKKDQPDISDEDAKSKAIQSLEPARRAIMAMEGTLGHDISVMARKASAYTIVYQNVRLLGYALFSNLIDPLGMMVNGAEFKDAYGAFKRGMRDVGREWGSLTGLRKTKESDRDDAVRVAEMIGTVDSSGFMSQMGTIYSSQYLPEWAKNANDTFFRWNGLEAFNKSMRVGATQAAISFIKRHYEKPNDHSDRYFEELGLTRADVSIGPDGALNVENRQVQQAVMRWVDGAILRPNAAIRPTMASDPHYAVFYHLKQFMYAMHAVILKRAYIEIKNGNNNPLFLLLAGYIPMMLAADTAKGLIQEATGNGQPYWQHDSVGGVVAHGVERAGLLGVGQLLTDTVQYGPLGLLGPAVEQATGVVTQSLGDSVAEATMIGPLSMVLRGPDSAEKADAVTAL